MLFQDGHQNQALSRKKKSLVNIKLQYVKVKLQQYLINHGDVHLNLNKVLMYQFHYDYIKEE